MRAFEPRIPRHLARQLGKEAVAISKSGKYVVPAGPVDISAAVISSLKKTAYHGPEHKHEPASPGPHKLAFEVTNETTLSAHRRHQAKGHNVVSLNFASATTPGGGFLTGARAQEEYLCRSSALYLTLKDWPMYGYHRAQGHCIYSDAMVYSPDVPVFRDDEHELLPSPYQASFITSAALLAKHLVGRTLGQLPEVLFNRMLKILSVAKSNGHDSLILGAWGCGAFGNDGNLVADIFHRALMQDFAGSFKEVTFAIVDTSPEQRFISPFAKRFAADGQPETVDEDVLYTKAARPSLKGSAAQQSKPAKWKELPEKELPEEEKKAYVDEAADLQDAYRQHPQKKPKLQWGGGGSWESTPPSEGTAWWSGGGHYGSEGW